MIKGIILVFQGISKEVKHFFVDKRK